MKSSSNNDCINTTNKGTIMFNSGRFYETIDEIKQNGFDVMKRATKTKSAGATTTCSCCGHDYETAHR